MGLLFLLAVRTSLSSGWTVLFAMPVGICLWVFASMLLLLTGIPYTLFLTLALIGLLLAALYLLRQHVPAFKTVSALSPVQGIQESAHLLLFFPGLMFLTASGFVYSFVSYDSFLLCQLRPYTDDSGKFPGYCRRKQLHSDQYQSVSASGAFLYVLLGTGSGLSDTGISHTEHPYRLFLMLLRQCTLEILAHKRPFYMPGSLPCCWLPPRRFS